MIVLNLDMLKVEKSHLRKVQKNLQYNELIGNFYEKMMKEPDNLMISDRLERKLERLQECNSIWNVDRYDKQKVKDFIKTNLCRDKFCNNCKKVKQAERMARFMPEIEKYKHYNMSQMVLTVPNVSGEELHLTIKKMFKSFAWLIDYLKLKRKIKGLDFSTFGYKGAIRSLEVTYSHDYHPHLHVLLIHEGVDGNKHNVNKFSYDKYRKKELRLFSDFEILLQKMWYLIFNGVRLTKFAIDSLDHGYSVMLDKFNENDFLELFKYMTKSDGMENGSIMSYQNFKHLYWGLHNVRQIQGYGCLFGIKDEDISDLAEQEYEKIIEELKKEENPVNVSETVQDLIKDDKYILISRKKIYKHLKGL